MSRGMDRDDIERMEEQTSQSRVTRSQGRAGGSASADDDPRQARRLTGARQPAREHPSHERAEVRYGRHRYEWSEVEREMLTEVGRFRTMDEKDIERVFYRGSAKQFRHDAEHLSRQGLLLQRSVAVGKRHDMRHVVVLSKKAKKLLQHQRVVQPGQALYAGFVTRLALGSRRKTIASRVEAEMSTGSPIKSTVRVPRQSWRRGANTVEAGGRADGRSIRRPVGAEVSELGVWRGRGWDWAYQPSRAIPRDT